MKQKFTICVDINPRDVSSSLKDILAQFNELVNITSGINGSIQQINNSLQSAGNATGNWRTNIATLLQSLTLMNMKVGDNKSALDLLTVQLKTSIGALKAKITATKAFIAVKKLFATAIAVSIIKIGLMRDSLLTLNAALIKTKTGKIAVKAVTTLWKAIKLLFIPIIGLAKIAVAAFNAILKANPIGALIAGVALAVVAIVGLVNWLNRGTDAGAEFESQNEQSREAMEALNDSIESNRRAHEDGLRSIEATRRVNDGLIGSLKDLHTQGDLDVAQRARIRHSVEQLNDSMEGLNLVIDEETGLLTESSQMLLEQAGLYNEVNAARSEAELILNRMNDANEKYIEAGMELELLEMRRYRILNDENISNRERRRLLSDLDDQVEELTQTQEYLSQSIYDLGYMHSNVYNGMTDQAYEFAEAQEMIAMATEESVERQKLSFEDLSSAQQDVVTQLNRTFNNHVDQLRGANGKIRENNDFTAAHWRRTMEHNQEVMTKWANNVDSLTERVSYEMLDYIRSLGPEHAHLVQDLVRMSDDELAEMEAVFKNNCQVAANAALAGIDNAQIPMEVANLIFESERSMTEAIRDADFANLGLNLAEGLRDGIKEGEHLVGTGAAALAREAEKAAREESETNSPSKVFYRIGEGLVTGLCQGIERLQPQAVTVMQTLTRNMKRVYNGKDREYSNIGRQIMSGLNQGLLNGEGQVMATANRIAQNIARTMQQALQINSPSRLMREQIGRHIPTGVAAGIEKYADVAIDSVYKLGHDLVKLNLPSVESMIGIGPSMRLAGASGNTTQVVHDNYSVSNKGLFDGATINWHGEEDIRRTMEKIAWATEREKARMW